MPEIQINIGGTWKFVGNPSVKVSGFWKDVRGVWVRVGGVWKTVFNRCSLDATDVVNTRVGACQAGVQYNTNGVEYSCTNVGVYNISRGNWLDGGDASGVWFICINNGPGTLDVNELSSRTQMTATKYFEIYEPDYEGLHWTNVTVQAWSDSSGGLLLASATFDVSAENTEVEP